MRSIFADLRGHQQCWLNMRALGWFKARVSMEVLGFLALYLASPFAFAQSVSPIANRDEFAMALRELQPGATLVLAPGEYGSDWYVTNVDRLTIRAADPPKPPRFTGGKVAIHFSKCSHLHLDGLTIAGQSQNGLNLDDGGPNSTPPHSVTLEHLTIENIGPKGNCDGIKASGIEQLKIQHCSFTGWAGQGIDLVGCHHVMIDQCQFHGKEGFAPSAGIQAKGGSSDVQIQDCQLQDAGERLINIGGSTGLPFFRPQGIPYEAKDVLVRSCRLQGGLCAIAFVGVDGAVVENNTIHYPQKWIVRILQETKASSFLPSQNGVFRNNKILFRREQISSECNVGAGTAPETFRFEENQWYAVDQPQRSKPKLPVEELNGRYGIDFR